MFSSSVSLLLGVHKGLFDEFTWDERSRRAAGVQRGLSLFRKSSYYSSSSARLVPGFEICVDLCFQMSFIAVFLFSLYNRFSIKLFNFFSKRVKTRATALFISV